MDKLNRRSALAFGLVAAATAAVKPAAAQTMDMTAGKDTTLAPGAVQRAYGSHPPSSPASRASQCVTSSCSRDRRLATTR